MPNGDVTEDDPELGQAGPPAGPPGGAPPGGPPTPGGGPGLPGGNLISMARQRMGPQVSAPGPGNMADSMNLVIQAINTLKQAGLGLQPGSKIHADVFKTISTLSRHLGGAAGIGPAAGIQKTQLGDQLKRTVQNMLLQRVLGSQGQGGKQPGGPPPMPSTPLPGS